MYKFLSDRTCFCYQVSVCTSGSGASVGVCYQVRQLKVKPAVRRQTVVWWAWWERKKALLVIQLYDVPHPKLLQWLGLNLVH